MGWRLRSIVYRASDWFQVSAVLLPSLQTYALTLATSLLSFVMMVFLILFLLASFHLALGGKNETVIAADSTPTELELQEESSECTTSSKRGNFSGCHSEEITRYKVTR